MANVYSLVCENGTAGSYWSNLSTDDRLRYGPAGSERVYDGLAAWFSARSVATTSLTVEVVEIADAFEDEITSGIEIDYASFGAFGIVITTMVKGSCGAGFHRGSVTGGYVLKSTGGGGYYTQLQIKRSDVIVNGLRFYANQQAVYNLRTRDGYGNRIVNNIVESVASRGFYLACDFSLIMNNLAYNCGDCGFYVNGYAQQGSLYVNNSAIDCNVGWYGGGSSTYGSYFNNLAFGCNTNWDAPPTSPDDKGMHYNVGESGDTPWGDNSTTTLVSSDFQNYASQDFTPSNASAHQVGAGTMVQGVQAVDMLGAVRPNYNPSGEEEWDAGHFEFDHGNGLAPETIQFTLTGLQAGTEVRVYKVSDGTELFGVENSGTTFTNTYTYTGDFDVDIILHHTMYEYIRMENVTLSNDPVSIPIQQRADGAYRNP